MNYPGGTKSFGRWLKEISNAAKLINYENYDWKQVAVIRHNKRTMQKKLVDKAVLKNNIMPNKLDDSSMRIGH